MLKRLTRLCFTLLALAFLLCFLATAALWIRSRHTRDIVSYGRPGGNCHLAQSLLGHLHVMSHLDGGCSGGSSHQSDELSPQAIWNGGMSGYPVKPEWRLGMIWQTYTRNHMDFMIPSGNGGVFVTHHRLIVIPYWLPTTLFALAPTAWLIGRTRRRRRQRAGLCPNCGYDLRATPDRCPECGRSASNAI
jgi:hypothetical protein